MSNLWCGRMRKLLNLIKKPPKQKAKTITRSLKPQPNPFSVEAAEEST